MQNLFDSDDNLQFSIRTFTDNDEDPKCGTQEHIENSATSVIDKKDFLDRFDKSKSLNGPAKVIPGAAFPIEKVEELIALQRASGNDKLLLLNVIENDEPSLYMVGGNVVDGAMKMFDVNGFIHVENSLLQKVRYMEMYLYFMFVLSPMVIGIFRFQSLRGEGKVLTIQLGLTIIFTVVSAYMKIKGIEHMFIYHIQAPLDYSFYSLVLFAGTDDKVLKKAIIISIICIIPSAIVLTIFFNSLDENNSYFYSLSYFLLIVWSLKYLFNEVKSASSKNLFRI